MNHKQSFILAGLLLVAAFLCLGSELMAGPKAALAGSTPPPRDSLTPGPPDDDDDDDDDDEPVGAYLELATDLVPAGAWTVVQWQDSAGEWREVEGWRGELATGHRWWVHPKDFGAGPFRWLVTEGPDGPVIGISPPFQLPAGANQVAHVSVLPGG
jgi:hypothetical protein